MLACARTITNRLLPHDTPQCEVVASARVPIAKIVCQKTGLQADISVRDEVKWLTIRSVHSGVSFLTLLLTFHQLGSEQQSLIRESRQMQKHRLRVLSGHMALGSREERGSARHLQIHREHRYNATRAKGGVHFAYSRFGRRGRIRSTPPNSSCNNATSAGGPDFGIAANVESAYSS